MINQTVSVVFVYHDETKGIVEGNLKAHIFLFVPSEFRTKRSGTLFGNEEECINCNKLLYNKIIEVRKKYSKELHKFHFTDISGKKWTKYDIAEQEIVKVGVDALRNKNSLLFRSPLCCRIAIIFYNNPASFELYGGDSKAEKKLRYNETLMRMLLKGAVHYLYDNNNKVKICKIVTDGEPYHRKISEERVLWTLLTDDLLGRSPLRNYVSIPDNAEIIHQDSHHKNYEVNSEPYIHANMLQLADMMLGSICCSCYKGVKVVISPLRIDSRVENKKGIIASPIKEMLDKRKRGKNFRHSSHYRSFTISRAFIENKLWEFENIMTKEVQITPETNQLNLFDLAFGEDT